MDILVAQPIDYSHVADLIWKWDFEQDRYIGIFLFYNHRSTMSKSKRVDFPRWISVA